MDPRAGVQRARKKKEPKRNTRARHGGNSDSVDSTTTFDFPPEAAAQFAYAASSSRVVQPTYGFTQFVKLLCKYINRHLTQQLPIPEKI